MPSGYEPLSNQTDQERELDEAFEDDEDAHESTPLARSVPAHDHQPVTAGAAAGYDFEREYVYNNNSSSNPPDDWIAPPPGSPTQPSANAVPNTYGNSNGLVPTEPAVVPPRRQHSGPAAFFRRAIGAVLPTHYAPLPTEDTETAASGPSHTLGSGIQNDGVFSNLSSKPQAAQTVRTESGEIHVVPENTQKEVPPTYSEAQADSVPPYWETTVHAPATATADGEMLVDGLASGSFIIFVMSMGVSFFFQFVGFLLTYLLHTSHAGKYGSRAGLGLTLIQYGFYSKTADDSKTDNTYSFWRPHMTATADEASPTGDMSMSMGMGMGSRDENAAMAPDDSYVVVGNFTTKDWLSFILMTIGWFLFLSSLIGFLRVKRWEKNVRDSSDHTGSGHTVEELQRDIEIRRNIGTVFGFDIPADEQNLREDAHGNVIVIPDQRVLEEARLTRDLRAAGLL